MPDLPVTPPDIATRLLSAAVYLEPGFADEVHGMLIGDGLTAAGPAVGLEFPVLLQHAIHSRRIRAYRDCALSFCWALALFGAAGPLLITRGTKDLPPAAFGAAVGVASAATLAWTIATAARWIRVHTAATLLRSPRSPLLCAPPLDDRLHGEMVLDQGAEVVCYSAAAESPFAAFGVPVDAAVAVSVPIVTASRVPDAGGDRVPPPQDVSLDAADLHFFLRERLRAALGGGGASGDTGVDIRSKLFIRGDAINDAAALWPRGDKGTRPPRAAQALLYSGIDDPGDRGVTYLSFEAVPPGGQLAVTMHVRIRVIQERLSLEIASHVAAPLAARYTVADRLPRTRSGLRSHSRWHAFLDLPSAMTAAPVDPFVRVLERRAVIRGRLRKLRALRRGKNPDRGAPTSIRRLVMDRDKLGYQEETAVRDVLQRFRRALFDNLLDYFEDQGLSTAELVRHRDDILMPAVRVREIPAPLSSPSPGPRARKRR